ncbi:TPA: MGMT family protein [Candidatus Bathyarchaeota archaeon]|nr:MGMT family protein [Candidatus Bathyarchaeota archaeon]
MRRVTEYQRAVLDVVKRIPERRVATYGMIAEVLGSRRLARAVGQALRRNPAPVRIPCHRVVCSDGRVGGYAAGVEEKIRLLRSEGIAVRSGRVDLSRYLVDRETLEGR